MAVGIVHFFDLSRFISVTGSATSGTVYFYHTGTNTLAPIYTNAALTLPAANPINVASGAVVPQLFLDPAVTYRRKIVFADGSVHDEDPIAISADLTLRSELAAETGSSMLGFSQDSADAELRTLQDKVRERLSINDFEGADPTGATDSAAAINSAIVEAQATGQPIYVDGVYLYNSQIIVPSGVRFIGCGHLVSDKSQRSKSCFVKNFNGVGFLFSGDETGTNGVQYDSVAGKTGNNVQVTGTRWSAPFICLTNSGNDNLLIGKTEAGASTINANGWFIGRLHSYGAVRDGMRLDHTNTTSGTTFPLGAPDCGGGTLVSFDIRDNGGSGIVLANTIDNRIIYGLTQQNAEYGIRYNAGAYNNQVDAYSEDNVLGDVLLDVPVTNGAGTAKVRQNVGFISRAASLTTIIVDNSGNNSNRIDCHNANVGGTTFDLAPIAWNGDFYQGSMLTVPRNTLEHKMYVSANFVPGGWKVSTDGASGTKVTFITRTTGIGETDKVDITNDGFVDIKTAGKGLKVAGIQVVGPQGAAITDASNAAAAPTKAEFDALVGKFNTLLARVRAHGLILT